MLMRALPSGALAAAHEFQVRRQKVRHRGLVFAPTVDVAVKDARRRIKKAQILTSRRQCNQVTVGRVILLSQAIR